MCPDDRADWPVFPNCADPCASSANCATESQLYTHLSNFPLHTTNISVWNDSEAFLERAEVEIQVLSMLQTASIKLHGDWYNTNTNNNGLNSTKITYSKKRHVARAVTDEEDRQGDTREDGG